jgi:putative Mn2+ efflux pump MntP
MSKDAGSDVPAGQASPAGAKPQGALMRWVTQIVYWIAGVVFLIIGVARLYSFFFPSLPDCDDEATRSTLSEIFQKNNLEPTAYNATKTLTKSKDELTCSASLAMKDGSTMEIAYRIFWQGKEGRVEITRQDLNADPK